MGKQKYPNTTGGITTDGTPKQRNNTKSGKRGQRRELRRLQAIKRQVIHIQTLERALEKAKDKSKFQSALTGAQLTLQRIRGGVPHSELRKQF